MYTPTAFLNWSALGPATTAAIAGTVTADTSDNVAVTVGSNMLLQRQDNTQLAWSSSMSAWIPVVFANPGTVNFPGHFNGPTTPGSAPATGDSLLVATPPSGNSPGYASMTMSFSAPLYYVEFQVSSRGAGNPNTDFIATLEAFDALGNEIGSYQIADTGAGGTCTGLSDAAGPVPCNDAPEIQFYDPDGRIRSVSLIVNDTTGAEINTLEIAAIPEPAPAVLTGFGTLVLLFAARRRRRGVFGCAATAPRN